ncbi:zinc finger MYM-type protein 1-like, partial [Tachysurus ichikawai]
MQSPSMQLDVAVDMLKKNRDSLDGYRNTGFSSAQVTAKEMCEEMNVEAVIKQKRLRSTKRHFGYEAPDESIGDALKKSETNVFNVVVDTALSSLATRSQTLGGGEVNDTFGVLLNFPNMSKEELLEHCQTLSTALSHDGQPDIDCRELTFLHEKKLMEIYPD